MTHTQETRLALDFARLHDWGRFAYLEDGWICGIIDAYTIDGKLYEDETRLRPRLAILREFGGY